MYVPYVDHTLGLAQDHSIITLTLVLRAMSRGVIDAPLHDVVAFIKDLQNNYIWDKYIVVSL